ncbi:MAG: gamma-glutamyl-gamma-aminobutyrate hydrolase family protein [Treponema sp.]|jgi:putative glutamine amidotransferase|nr:gamma-glutamyl-gamma-aminobutyrate hydrolase family protein [Treponema sp.]
MLKPVIGVVPIWDEKQGRWWMRPGYMEGIIQAGGLPLMLPMTLDEDGARQFADLCAGFLFTGGGDVSPHYYGAEILPCCGSICKERDTMEKTLFSIAVLQHRKNAFGICRGIQLFNVFLGGTLYQDIPTQLPKSRISHNQRPPYNRTVHQVQVEPGSLLRDLLGTDTLAVNSSHHQAIAELSPQLIPMARSKDGLIEAVCMKDRPFVWGVQWHPEWLLSEESHRKLFDRFVDACR